MIRDKVFDTRGQKLFCNSETNVTSVLARGGWDRSSPVMTPVITTERGDSAKVLGSRYAVRGNLADVTFNASTVWPQLVRPDWQ